MGLGKSRRQSSGVEYCWPDRSLGWQKGLEGAVVGETMQFALKVVATRTREEP